MLELNCGQYSTKNFNVTGLFLANCLTSLKKHLKKDGTHFPIVQRGKIELVVSENIQTYHRRSLEIQLRKGAGGVIKIPN